ncbi:PREDICTED: uncharacterized protein LOC107170214 [Diuraphis noxia]|uniref:uncharacterized protein LOC107170214 n=1 Tax=Diuraphis noxia TaxID=143948 RepID=UPI0007636F2B|nr:PREDICTED: uncharacterized protein LOC107170214 [Diuraphis noxia]
MIFRGIVSAMVFVAIASASVIHMPDPITTPDRLGYQFSIRVLNIIIVFAIIINISVRKQSCDEILKSMEAEASEFPIIQIPTNGATPSATNDGIHAFHCCQTQRCNGNQSGPAEGSVKSAQAVLVAELKNTVASQVIPLGVQNSTVGVPWTPAVESSVNNADLPNNKSEINNIELSNTKKMNASTSDLWHSFFSMGQPNAPSALQSDNSSEIATFIDATTPAIPAAMPPTSPVAVPDNQEITHDGTASHLEHVVSKRHDRPKGM